MWLIFALRFKKIFSTDDIINRTRSELNEMLSDINRSADRNIVLIDERIKQLKAVSAEADRHLEILRREITKIESTQAFEAKLAAVSAAHNSEQKNKVTAIPSSSKTASITGRYTQGDLFITDKAREELAEQKIKPSEEINSSSSSDRIHLIPIIEPEIFASEKMNEVPVRKDFKTQVMELHNLGETTEEIAAKLGRSIQEVKFLLEFS